MCLPICLMWYLQSLLRPLEESLTKALVLWDGLQDVAFHRHVPDRPLTQPRAAQSEYVAGNEINYVKFHS